MKRRTTVCVVIALLTLPIAADPPPRVNPERANPAQRDDSQPRSVSKLTPLMQMKLDKSKAILEGLTLEDFDRISSNAQSLRLLSTEAGWNVIQSAEYDAQSRDFRRSVDIMVDAAKNKDVSRAAMGYVAMTVRCVECHSYMRKHRDDKSTTLQP